MSSSAAGSLQADIAAYDGQLEELKASHPGKWVLFHAGQFIDAFGDFAAADAKAIEEFHNKPCLIRKVGEGPSTVPSSILFGANGIS